jgi:two-component system, NtrC family, response regulator AtoC
VRGRVLILDDEPDMCLLLEAQLGPRGFQTASCTRLVEAERLLAATEFDVVVADLQLREASGLDLCKRLASERPDLPVVIITGFGSMESAVAAIRAGAYDFITKPFEIEELELTRERAVGHRHLREEVKRLRRVVAGGQEFESMLGSSPAMHEVFDLIRRVADTEASVLITGESGTGKEMVARAIHRQGRWKDGPFVALNCAAVPETLIESELFGHVKGAFTDAHAQRIGLFAQADGGTLFLDEISDLSVAVQPKLLRSLQERKVRPLGSSTEVPFNARLICASNRDLEAEVRSGRFREDLFFRVAVIHIEVPALRARGNDVLLLAQHFLELFSARSGTRLKGISGSAAACLREYPWPGNVRELQNCIERGVALAQGDEITIEDLPDRIRHHRGVPPPVPFGPDARLLTLEEVERAHILQVLDAVGGNKSQAARILGLDRKTLYRRLGSYGLLAEE